MSIFIKATGGVLIAAILYLVLSKQEKELSLLLTIAVCSMVAFAASEYLQPVIDFMIRLQSLGKLDPELLQTVLRSVGIAMLSEITSLICIDAGNASMGKVLQFLGCAVILGISVPIFSSLISLIEEILVSV